MIEQKNELHVEYPQLVGDRVGIGLDTEGYIVITIYDGENLNCLCAARISDEDFVLIANPQLTRINGKKS